jgi:tRNA-uridine 2-sulfurtransferase
MRKALALISGGLDSMLAAKLILQQGIHVEGINFFTGFCGVGSVCISRANKLQYDAQWVANKVGIKLHVIDVVAKFKAVLINPQYGYGAHLNPCIDCKLFMVTQGFKWMKANGFDFLVTGEVVGQRPMSQRKATLPIVAKDAEDLLLRPLCAKLLEPTLPERKGWVDRDLLCDIGGRGRKPQIVLAHHFGFAEYPQPAGGCVLTEIAFVRRLKDFWKYTKNGSHDYNLRDIMLLKVGRHIRPNNNFKIIVGRDQLENEFLTKYRNQYLVMFSTSHVGPIALLEGKLNATDFQLAAQITAYFGKGKQANEVAISVVNADKKLQDLVVVPLQEISSQWYV